MIKEAGEPWRNVYMEPMVGVGGVNGQNMRNVGGKWTERNNLGDWSGYGA